MIKPSGIFVALFQAVDPFLQVLDFKGLDDVDMIHLGRLPFSRLLDLKIHLSYLFHQL